MVTTGRHSSRWRIFVRGALPVAIVLGLIAGWLWGPAIGIVVALLGCAVFGRLFTRSAVGRVLVEVDSLTREERRQWRRAMRGEPIADPEAARALLPVAEAFQRSGLGGGVLSQRFAMMFAAIAFAGGVARLVQGRYLAALLSATGIAFWTTIIVIVPRYRRPSVERAEAIANKAWAILRDEPADEDRADRERD